MPGEAAGQAGSEQVLGWVRPVNAASAARLLILWARAHDRQAAGQVLDEIIESREPFELGAVVHGPGGGVERFWLRYAGDGRWEAVTADYFAPERWACPRCAASYSQGDPGLIVAHAARCGHDGAAGQPAGMTAG